MKYPSDLNTGNSAYISFTPYKWTVTGRDTPSTSTKKQKDGETIVLSIANFSLTESENWGEFSGFFSALAQGKGWGALTAQGVKKLAENLGQNLSGVVSTTTGKIVNDFTSLMYNGINLIENGFNFSFTPKSEEDIKSIKSIITEFRTKSLPELDGGYLKYPDLWDVQVRVAGKLIDRYPNCVITNFTLNFADNGKFTFFKGEKFPTKITMSLSIKEVSIRDREKVKTYMELMR